MYFTIYSAELLCRLLSFVCVQVIQWMQQPTEINGLRDFAVWKEKCDIKVN